MLRTDLPTPYVFVAENMSTSALLPKICHTYLVSSYILHEGTDKLEKARKRILSDIIDYMYLDRGLIDGVRTIQTGLYMFREV